MKTSFGAYAISLAVNLLVLAAVAWSQGDETPGRSPATWLTAAARTSRRPAPPPGAPRTPVAIEFVMLSPAATKQARATGAQQPKGHAVPHRTAAQSAMAIAASPNGKPPGETPLATTPVGAAPSPANSPGRLGMGIGARVLSQQMAGVAGSALGQPTARDPNAWARSLGPLAIGPRERGATYQHQGEGTTGIGGVDVTTAPDGRLAMKNQPPVDVRCCIFWIDLEGGGRVPMPGIFGRLDTTEIVAALAGYDLYYAKKLAYADDTREARAAMRQAYTKELAAASGKMIAGHVRALWEDPTRSFAEKRRDLCQLWREGTPSPDVVDPNLRAAAAAAQRAIMRFIRETLPAGSPHAFTPDELHALNAERPAHLRCWPYGPPAGP